MFSAMLVDYILRGLNLLFVHRNGTGLTKSQGIKPSSNILKYIANVC